MTILSQYVSRQNRCTIAAAFEVKEEIPVENDVAVKSIACCPF